MFFLYFHLFFYIFLSAACRNKALFYTELTSFYLPQKVFFEKIIINAWSSATIWRTFVISLQKNT